MKKIALLVGLAAAFGCNNAQAVDWNWKGDVRYRYESSLTDYDNVQNEKSRDRHRMRVRLGVYPWINEELSAGVQLSTGDDKATETISRNQTLGGIFQPKNFYLNEAFIDYHPMFLDGNVNLILGKRDISNTLIRIDNLVYDSDLTMEGATIQYGKDASGKEKAGPVLVTGYYLLNEDSGENDPFLYIAQGAYSGEISDITYLVGAGYNMYRNLENLNYGKLNGGSDSWPYHHAGYNIAEIFTKIGGQITETLPWKLYGQYAFNTSDHDTQSKIDNSKRTAWLAGVTIGDAKQPGQWSLDGKYVSIERDAVFPLFTDSDRKTNSQLTNIRGFEVAATYHLVQNMSVGARYYRYKNIDKSAGDPTLNTLQVDAVVKF